MKTKPKKDSMKRRVGWLPSALRGAGVGLAVVLLLLFLFCAIACATEDPGPLVVPLSLCALYLGGIAAGICSSKLSKGGAAGGFLAGCVLAVFVFLLSCFPLSPSSFPPSAAWIFLGLLLPAGALGGILGTKKQPNRRARR